MTNPEEFFARVLFQFLFAGRRESSPFQECKPPPRREA